MKLALALAGTALSAALFGPSFAPIGLWPLAFVCLVPLLLVLRSGSLLRAVVMAWLWAVLSALAISSVFPGSIAVYFDQPLVVGWLFAIAIYSVMASLYYVAFTPVYRALVKRAGPALPLVVAAAWSCAELLRGRLFTGTEFLVGNPWGLLGYTLAGVGPLAQGAALFGVYGLSFAVVAVNAALAEWIVAVRRGDRSHARPAKGLALACVPTLALAIYGVFALRGESEPAASESFVKVAIAQGNVSLERRWRSDYYGANLDVYLGLTRQALRDSDPRVVYWPEGALTFFVEAEPRYRRAIGQLLEAGDAQLLMGGPSGEGDREPPFFNSVFAMEPSGQISARYDKQVLVPFSEFFPLSGFDFMRRPLQGARSLVHGRGSGLVDTRVGLAGLLVCNEAMLPELAADRVREGAEYLFSPSNDSWLAGEGFAEHMLQVVSLRAIEQRRYLVRASTSGPSALIDPWGRVKVRSAPFERQIVVGRVRPLHERSVYSRIGDAFVGVCAAVVAGFLFAQRGRSDSPGRGGQASLTNGAGAA